MNRGGREKVTVYMTFILHHVYNYTLYATAISVLMLVVFTLFELFKYSMMWCPL